MYGTPSLVRGDGPNARDGTRYGTSRLAPRTFYRHHVQRISMAAAIGDVQGLHKAVLEFRDRCSTRFEFRDRCSARLDSWLVFDGSMNFVTDRQTDGVTQVGHKSW